MGIRAPVKLDLVDVQKETVRTVSTMQFATLKEMVGLSPMLWSHSGLYFNSMQLEKDKDSNLRLTLNTASRGSYLKNIRQQWKLMKQNSELRIIFPGKVLTSAFPQKDDKATWVAIDAEKDETMQAALKLMESPVVVTAEPGGLSLDQPLNSQKLRMSMRGGADAEPDLPITEAGPGFAAEPVSVTTSTVYYFPDGMKQLKNSAIYELQTTGTTVHAKLFAPKGRTIQSVSGIKVLSAKDDKGRLLAQAESSEDDVEGFRSYGGRGRDSASTQIQLQLPLPQADAQSIDEISAQAIVSSIGRWKEMSIAEVRTNSQTPTDLAAVLPGAKLTISKIGVKNNQLTITLKVDGPPSIRQLDFKVQLAGEENFTSYASDRNMSGAAKGGTRTVQVQGYAGNLRTMPADGVTLVVRYPEELKRERVNFKLKALDLF
jgi:hypothetical protein